MFVSIRWETQKVRSLISSAESEHTFIQSFFFSIYADVYYYGGRSVDHVEKYDSRADEIFKNNKVTYSLHAVNQTNCPNEQKFYLP